MARSTKPPVALPPAVFHLLLALRDGEQHAFHASRRAPQEPTDLQIGPFAIDVLEPMRRIRVSIDENDTGISTLGGSPRSRPL